MLNYNSSKPLSSIELILMQKYGSSALSIEEVAKELEVETSDVQYLLNNGDLNCKSICSKTRIMIPSLVDFMNGIAMPKTNVHAIQVRHKINDILDIVLENKKRECKKLSSYNWYCIMSKHIRMAFEGADIEDLDKIKILQFLNNISVNKKGKLMSHKFILAVSLVLKNVINYALQEQYINFNPFSYIKKIPQGKVNNPKNRVLSNSVISKLSEVLAKSRTFKPMVVLMLRTGMRIGEVLALHWSDVDRENGIIHVEHGLSLEYDEDEDGNLINKRYEIGETKTVCSVREITTDSTVFEVLNQWKDYITNNKSIMKKIQDKGTCDIIFVNRFGDVRSYQALQKSFQRFLKDNGLVNEHITFHMFRHTYATLLQDAGVDINIIRELLGHSDIQTTANIYVKVNNEPKRRATELFSHKMNQIISKF